MNRSRTRRFAALVPVKSLEQGKNRLAPTLTPCERARLVEAMLGDVLDVLKRASGLDEVLVLSSDPSIVALGLSFGAKFLPDRQEWGMNDAVRAGLARFASDGRWGGLVVPADVPYISDGEIQMAISALGENEIVLARASRDGGTNLLGLAPTDAIAPCFGPHSFVKHLSAARLAGFEPVILPATCLARDIDLPGDLEPFGLGGAALRTRRFLAERSKGSKKHG
jgi:2-phospho-L-lactate guanylyltransferase